MSLYYIGGYYSNLLFRDTLFLKAYINTFWLNIILLFISFAIIIITAIHLAVLRAKRKSV